MEAHWPLLLHTPNENILAPLSEAIQQCVVFPKLSRAVLFEEDGGVVLSRRRLCSPGALAYRSSGTDTPAIEYAAGWLRESWQRVRRGAFTVAIWGLDFERETRIGENLTTSAVHPLQELPMKRRVLERTKAAWNQAVWTSHSYFDKPAVALVKRVEKFPYIGSPRESFDKLIEVEESVRKLSFFLQAAVAGQPLAVGS